MKFFYYLIVLFLFVIVGFVSCKKKVKEGDVMVINNVKFDLYNIDESYKTLFKEKNFMYINQSQFNSKRLIFIHGCISGDANHETCLMNTPSYANLVDSLTNIGWQVIEFDLPNKKSIPDYWNDGGVAYKKAYLSKLKQVISWSEINYGHANNYYIGGISYGGLHALMGAGQLKVFTKYFAILPVIKIGWLEEFRKYFTKGVTEFDPSINFRNLAYSKGLLGWNTSDQRVNYRYADTLYHHLVSINAPIEHNSIDTGGHTAGDINYAFKFLNK